jgi:hypothetical protein
MIGLDIGVNQGFSQCEDWSVCDIGLECTGHKVGGQRLLEVCLPFSFPDQPQGRKLGTLRPFGINYRSDFSCYYLLGGVWEYYNLPPRQSFFLKEFPASLNFSLDVCRILDNIFKEMEGRK